MERVRTKDLKTFGGRTTRSFIENSWVLQTILKLVGVLGVSLVMSGGQTFCHDFYEAYAGGRWCSYSCTICAWCNPGVRLIFWGSYPIPDFVKNKSGRRGHFDCHNSRHIMCDTGRALLDSAPWYLEAWNSIRPYCHPVVDLQHVLRHLCE